MSRDDYEYRNNLGDYAPEKRKLLKETSRISPRLVITIHGMPKLSELDVLELVTYLKTKARDLEEIAKYSTQREYAKLFRMRLMK